jgi:hypothetical protein
VVTPGGRKLVGLAQARRSTGTLTAASLLVLDPDWTTFCTAMRGAQGDAERLAAQTASCSSILGYEPKVASVAGHLAAALTHGFS